MVITIIGGGNIGTQFAVHCAAKGHNVRILTSSTEVFGKTLTAVDENDSVILEGDIVFATSDPGKALTGADAVFVTFPSNLMKKAADQVYTFCGRDTLIGVVPGNGGSECAFRRCIEKGNTFFCIERVPAVARLVKKGCTVRSVGYRQELHTAAVPSSEAERCASFVSSIFDIPCRAIPSVLSLTLTPSNPVLHTTRLMTIFRDYREGTVYDRLPLFYEEWDDETTELLFRCDEEVQKICRSLPMFDLSDVKSLREHYESPTPELLTRKIRSIKAFKGLGTPSVKTADGYIPDLHSRYFTADFSYGLSAIVQAARFAGTDIPALESVLGWYDRIKLEKDVFRYEDYGIRDTADFLAFYSL
jgi:hypothetical protein